MRSLPGLALAAAVTSGLAVSAIKLDPATIAPRELPAKNPGFVSFPIEHKRRIQPLNKRADTNVPLFNISSISYLIEMSVGTPGQAIKVAIDTGSDELWVNPQCNNVEDADQRAECIADGHYSPNNSSTSVASRITNVIPYGKGKVSILYFKDNITLPESTVSLSQVIFGVATSSQDLNEGIMGLGYGNGVNLDYSNFVDVLADQGVTQSRAFTVALGSVDANNGGILVFGGLDTKKFSGNLVSLPILGPQGRETIRRYWVNMSSVGVTLQGQSPKTYNNSAAPVVLDTGSSLSYLPRDVVEAMAADTGARFSSASGGVYIVNCAQAQRTSTFDFVFGSGTNTVKVSVPFKEFIWEAGPGDCVLGAIEDTDGVVLLGDTFLRSAYTVFDQTSNAVFMGQYANCGQNEQVIPSSPAGAVASMTGECQPGATSGAGGSGSGSGSGSGKKDSLAVGRLVPGRKTLIFTVIAVAYTLGMGQLHGSLA